MLSIFFYVCVCVKQCFVAANSNEFLKSLERPPHSHTGAHSCKMFLNDLALAVNNSRLIQTHIKIDDR